MCRKYSHYHFSRLAKVGSADDQSLDQCLLPLMVGPIHFVQLTKHAYGRTMF